MAHEASVGVVGAGRGGQQGISDVVAAARMVTVVVAAMTVIMAVGWEGPGTLPPPWPAMHPPPHPPARHPTWTASDAPYNDTSN